MAFLIKNTGPRQASSASRQGFATIDQWIQVSTAARALPATTTDQLFRVKGGRVMVKCLVGQVTVVIQAQACTVKVTSKALDTASVAVGTAVDICSTVDINGKEVGSFYFVEGDGTAGVLSNAGGSFVGTNSGYFVAPQGEIYITTSATNTGSYKWDLFYQPIDQGAYAESVVTAAVAI